MPEHKTTDENGHGATQQQALGLSGWMAKAFIHSPLTLLFLISCLAIGILGFIFTPRQEDPQIDVPMVDIFFQFPGASSEQVSSLATDPLERMMSEIAGVKHVYSASQRGAGMVTVQFDVGQRMEPSLVKLYDKLASNLDKMPPGVSQPLVKPKAVDDVPIVTLTLWSDIVDDAGLRLVALEVMQRIKEVKNTSQSFIVGGRSEELRVEVSPERLRGYGVSLDQLAGVIKAANEKRSVGNVESGGQSMSVYTGQFLRHAEDIERLVAGVHNNSPVYVRDIARVIEGPGEASSIVQYFSGPAAPQGGTKAHGAAAITIAIAKKPGTNGVTVANAILEKIDVLKGRVIPDNVHVEVTRDYGKTANDKVNELFVKLTIATVAVSGLIFLFLGLMPTIVVGIIIPVVILLTVFSAWVLGYTIDRVSLFALIFSIGILVDDATVVIENIYRRWLMQGRIDTATTVDAVREVGNPTILATFTVIAALLPMGFVSGMMGPYMQPIPVLGSVAMLFSLFAAFMFTPWLAMRIRPGMARLQKMEASEHRLTDRLDRFYRRLLGPLIDHPWKARVFRLSIWAGFAACCLLFYTTDVSVKMLPMDNKPEFNVVVNMPEGTALPVTANVIQQFASKALAIPEVTAVQTYAGTASPYNFNGLVRHYYLRNNPWQGDIQIQLKDKSSRKRSSHEIASEMRQILTPMAKSLGARIAVVEMPPGPPVLQTVVAEIYGPDAETRRKVAKDVTEIFQKAESVGDVDNYLQAPHDTLVFVVDQRKAEHRHVSIGDIGRQLGWVMGGAKLGDAKLGYELESRNIVLQAPLEVRSNIARLGEIPIRTQDNQLVPLSELGQFVRQPQDPIIFHKDLRAVEYVTGEAVGRLAAPIYAMIEVSKLLKDYKTPDGVTLSGTLIAPPTESYHSGFEWTGEWTVTYETFRDMGLAFAAAMVLIYMLVVLEFGNFRLPGIIMAPIPLTLMGIIPGHWLLGAEFTATSMIGWIALAGIIVRNSILLVDFSKHAILAGVPVREAVIQSCRARTRPIIITSLALMGGSASIITDPIFQGMAISLLFGAAVSTALTLVVIPLACARAQGAYHGSTDEFDQALVAGNGNGAACSVKQPAVKVAPGGCPEPAVTQPSLGERVSALASAAYALVRAPLVLAGEGLQKLFGEKVLLPFYIVRAILILLWDLAYAGLTALLPARRSAGGPVSTGSGSTSGTGGTDSGGEPPSPPPPPSPAPVPAPMPAPSGAHSPTPPAELPAPSETPMQPLHAAAKEVTPVETVVPQGMAEQTAEPAPVAVMATNEPHTAPASTAKEEPQPEVAAAPVSTEAGTLPVVPASVTISASQTVPTVTSKAPEPSPKEPKVTEATRVDPVARANPVDQPADDLKLINGIGPSIERQLNAMGVTRFEQIANWSEADIERIGARLAVPGRIQRDNWVSQAVKFLKRMGKTAQNGTPNNNGKSGTGPGKK